MPSFALRGLAASVLFVLVACADEAPLGPGPSGEDADAAPVTAGDVAPATLATMHCRAYRSGTVECGLPADGPSAVIINATKFTTTFANVTSDTAADRYAFTLRVRNFVPAPQMIGTSDGTDLLGFDVFMVTAPQVSAGSGAVSLISHDGSARFTANDQKYLHYADTLRYNQISSGRRWTFDIDDSVESFTFDIAISADVLFPFGWVKVSHQNDTITVGRAFRMSATPYNAAGDSLTGRTLEWTSLNNAIANVDSTGFLTSVGGGSVTIRVRDAAVTRRSGTSRIAVCSSLGLGRATYLPLNSIADGFCLAGRATGAEYTIIPMNMDAGAAHAVSLTGYGIVDADGAPTPAAARAGALGAGSAQPDYAFERALRERELRELSPLLSRADRIAGSASGGPARAITPGVPAVGALMSINVNSSNACSIFDLRTGRVMAVGSRVIIMADTLNPAGLTLAQYDSIAEKFDTFVWDPVTTAFGTPADIDGNGRVIAFYTTAVNALTPPGSGSFTGGFYFARDAFSAAACPTSNVGEIFYMLAADPAGTVNGNVRSTAFVMEKTVATLAHEFQHLINASRRVTANGVGTSFETVWLNEGLSHIAEELVFYDVSGLAPGQNLDVNDIIPQQDAFFEYAESNFGRFRQYLLDPDGNGPFEGDDDLATRGAIWSFLRYAADRKGTANQTPFWSALSNTSTTGTTTLRNALGSDVGNWLRAWGAATYLDDTGLPVQAGTTQPSWNFRAIYTALDYDPGPACSCAYELALRAPANGVADSHDLSQGGGMSFTRVGVAPNQFASFALTVSGGTNANFRLAIVRRE